MGLARSTFPELSLPSQVINPKNGGFDKDISYPFGRLFGTVG